MTHPAQHHVDASKKRQRAWVEGRARGGKSDRPGKAGALKGGASEDRETQSDTRALVPHLRDARFPPPDTVAGAEEQKERARGGRLMRADGGDTKFTVDDEDTMDRASSGKDQPVGGGLMQHSASFRSKQYETPPQNENGPPVRAKGGSVRRASGGPTIPTPPYAGARTVDNRIDPSPATADRNEMRQMPTRDDGDKELARGGPAFRTPSGGVSAAARREAEGKRETMPGGKFPIRNASDLANAKHDVGRASDPAAARRWINRRAKELGEPPLGG